MASEADAQIDSKRKDVHIAQLQDNTVRLESELARTAAMVESALKELADKTHVGEAAHRAEIALGHAQTQLHVQHQAMLASEQKAGAMALEADRHVLEVQSRATRLEHEYTSALHQLKSENVLLAQRLKAAEVAARTTEESYRCACA